jgi:hypothetical protein
MSNGAVDKGYPLEIITRDLLRARLEVLAEKSKRLVASVDTNLYSLLQLDSELSFEHMPDVETRLMRAISIGAEFTRDSRCISNSYDRSKAKGKIICSSRQKHIY